MKTALTLVLFLAITLVVSSVGHTAKPPRNAPMINDSVFQSAAAATTVLGWWQFDTPDGAPTQQGWTAIDLTAQLATFFHVDGPSCNGVSAVSGVQSMWCGQWATASPPYCGWGSPPGYGNNWDQTLEAINASSIQYTCEWDSEPGSDRTYVEYYDSSIPDWVQLPVNGGVGYYDGRGGPLAEFFAFTGPTTVRFHFVSDLSWSDEDGLWPTSEGGFKCDDLSLDGGTVEDWEGEVCGATQSSDGTWTAASAAPFGLYAGLHSAATVVQVDPCERPYSTVWGFFDDPFVTNYACGGYPLQGALAYGPDPNGLYLHNEVWSPFVPITGSGSQFRLQFLVYKDLPIDNLQFFTWGIRTQDGTGCPGPWKDEGYIYYGGHQYWLREWYEVGGLVPAGATEIQVSVGVVDMMKLWEGIYGTGSCHSHAPLFDQVKLVRVGIDGPQWNVRHINLLQDNFPEDGTVTGFARCDMAKDILPLSNPGILPGDSAVATISDPSGLGTDETGGRTGPSAYVFVRVTDRYGISVGKNGTAIQSPDNQAYALDPSAGLLRYPHVGAVTVAGVPWDQYRMDYVYSPAGNLVQDVYCFDLMDIANGSYPNENSAENTGIFAPGDVVHYFLGARNISNQWSYWHRTLHGQGDSRHTTVIDEAAVDPCEWSVLPDAGREN
ncbi:MAG: hypothetical protein JSW50_09945, partial [Candidatus Latescibacterota bacterium]